MSINYLTPSSGLTCGNPTNWKDQTMTDPITAPRSPRTGEPLHLVPIGATVPGGVGLYDKDSEGRLYGPYILASDFRYYDTNITYWTEEPLPTAPDPEPEKVLPALLVGWWADLTDDQRAAYTALDSQQAGDLAELLPPEIIWDSRIADEGLTPVLHDLTSGDRGTVQGAIADLIAAWLAGDLE